MTAVKRAIWYIESRFMENIRLEDVARAAGLSRYHFSRAFGDATGVSVLRYVRGRRLTEAAKALAAGAPDILAVALEFGYGSHEAFTRAFREQFGRTPEQVRAARSLDHLLLTEPIAMTDQETNDIKPDRFEQARPMLIAGLTGRFTAEATEGIPALWQRFAQHMGHIDGQTGEACYGVCFDQNGAGAFTYMAGVEVTDTDGLPGDFEQVRIPEGRYAVFIHKGHISGLKDTFRAIWRSWLPGADIEADQRPELECYYARFDPRTGMGEVDIWIPVKG